MFDLGWSEFLIVSAVTIVVVGPKEIPRVLRTVSSGVRKARSYAFDFQRSVMEVADLEDLKDIKDTLTKENESFHKGVQSAAADMEEIRKQWETDWDAELAKDSTELDAELGIENTQAEVHDFLKPPPKASKNKAKKKTAGKAVKSKKSKEKKATTKKATAKKATAKKSRTKNMSPKKTNSSKKALS